MLHSRVSSAGSAGDEGTLPPSPRLQPSSLAAQEAARGYRGADEPSCAAAVPSSSGTPRVKERVPCSVSALSELSSHGDAEPSVGAADCARARVGSASGEGTPSTPRVSPFMHSPTPCGERAAASPAHRPAPRSAVDDVQSIGSGATPPSCDEEATARSPTLCRQSTSTSSESDVANPMSSCASPPLSHVPAARLARVTPPAAPSPALLPVLTARSPGRGHASHRRPVQPQHPSVFYPRGLADEPPVLLHYLQLGSWRTVAGGWDCFQHRRLRRGEVVGHSVRWLHNAQPRDRLVFLVDPVESVAATDDGGGGSSSSHYPHNNGTPAAQSPAGTPTSRPAADARERTPDGGPRPRRAQAVARWCRAVRESMFGTPPAFAFNRGKLVKQPSSSSEAFASSIGLELLAEHSSYSSRYGSAEAEAEAAGSGLLPVNRAGLSSSSVAQDAVGAPPSPSAMATVCTPSSAFPPSTVPAHPGAAWTLLGQSPPQPPSVSSSSAVSAGSPQSSARRGTSTEAAAPGERRKQRHCVEAIEVEHVDVTALDYAPRLTSSRLSIEARVVRTYVFDSMKEALLHYQCPDALPRMREQYFSGRSSQIPQQRRPSRASVRDATQPAPPPPPPPPQPRALRLVRRLRSCPDDMDDDEEDEDDGVGGSTTEYQSLAASVDGSVAFASGSAVPLSADGERLFELFGLAEGTLPSQVPVSFVPVSLSGSSFLPRVVSADWQLTRADSLYSAGSADGGFALPVGNRGPTALAADLSAAAPAVEAARLPDAVCDNPLGLSPSRRSPADSSTRTERAGGEGGRDAQAAAAAHAGTLSSTHFDTMVSIYTADPNFNAVVRELLMPDPPGAHPYTADLASQRRMLALYETGMPSWSIFLASTILPYRRSLRQLYGVLMNLYPLVSLSVGLYDLYKHLPQLKRFLAHTLDPLIRWVDQRFTVRVSVLVTYLVSVGVNIFASLTSFLSQFLFVQMLSLPLVQLFFAAVQMPFIVVFDTVWAVGSIAFSFTRLALMTVRLLFIGPFLLVLRVAALQVGTAAPAAVEGTSLTLRWLRAWQEFWVTVASPIKNLAKAWWDSVLHVCLSASRREASIRRWYSPKLQAMVELLQLATEVLCVNGSIAVDLFLRSYGLGQLAVQAAVCVYLAWLVFWVSPAMVEDVARGVVQMLLAEQAQQQRQHQKEEEPSLAPSASSTSVAVAENVALKPGGLLLVAVAAVSPRPLQAAERVLFTGLYRGWAALTLRWGSWRDGARTSAGSVPPATQTSNSIGVSRGRTSNSSSDSNNSRPASGPAPDALLLKENAVAERAASTGSVPTAEHSRPDGSTSRALVQRAEGELSVALSYPPASLKALWELHFLSSRPWLPYSAAEMDFFSVCGYDAELLAHFTLPAPGALRQPHRTATEPPPTAVAPRAASAAWWTFDVQYRLHLPVLLLVLVACVAYLHTLLM